MLGKDTTILITGTTGLIAGELVERLVRCRLGRILCLIRPTPEATAAQRLVERFERTGFPPLLDDDGRVEAISGDVTAPGFGMSAEDRDRVLQSVDLIIHCASELSFIRDASCRQTNIAGMTNLIELARQCRRSPRIVHMSTATVCGKAAHRCVNEADADASDEDHFNEYTRSKAAAERVLRESGLPALVVRPSIVLSADLPSEDFARAILWFLPLLNEFDAVPVESDSRVDVVPVSFVVDSMVQLLQRPQLAYDCYHISAGPAGALRCGDVGRYLDEFYGRVEPIKPIPPAQWTAQLHRKYVATRKQRKVFGTLKHYLPFLNMDVTYNNTRLADELGGGPLEIPDITEYLGGLLHLITPKLQVDGVLAVERIAQ
ncbi:MAG: NAD-dependent epimerase/dehydratase family protein [bacterium]|nr:NAD-dependent epimerase/dehydratase family protein [bacterium]